MRPSLVVGISGPSASGKTTLANALLCGFPDAVHLQQDLFFVDPEHCDPDSNFCDPRYLRVNEFVNTASLLAHGMPVMLPHIDFSTFERVGSRQESTSKSRLLIIEGMTIFRFPEIPPLCDLRFYLTPDLVAVQHRKLRRDMSERGKSESQVKSQMSWVIQEYEEDLAQLHPGGDLHAAAIKTVDSTDVESALRCVVKEVALQLGVNAIDGRL